MRFNCGDLVVLYKNAEGNKSAEKNTQRQNLVDDHWNLIQAVLYHLRKRGLVLKNIIKSLKKIDQKIERDKRRQAKREGL